ncbi:hypothetical protein CL614_04490 [archaeon]|jgi:hypothetical protein|nr:hypothetical protein [archaeon]|tara:strand:- start:159 stop:356 length:198 start_codon:yes stop_codon:yes gene_type:complete
MSDILEKWNEIKVLVDSLDLDLHKNASGNSSAGVRARKGLRVLKNEVGALVKITINEDKLRKVDN